MSVSFWVICYLLITLVIGVLASRLIHSSNDFLSASRRLPLIINASALFAFWFGSETVLGASSEFIQHGILGVIEDPFGGFLCLMLFGLIFVRPLYRRNILTLGDLFRKVYGVKIERLSAVLMIISFFGYVAAQIIALGILFHTVFGMDEWLGRIVSALIVTGYTAAGGMWSVSITDFVQSVMIVVGLLLIAIQLTGLVDTSLLFTSTKPDYFDVIPTVNNEMSWMDYFAAWCALGLGSLASQDIFQRANAAKSEKIAVRSTYLGAFLYLIFAMIPLYLGLVAHQLVPELTTGDTEHTIMQMIGLYAPTWLQIVFYGSLVSAIFSTCSGSMLAPASLLAENLIKPAFYPQASDKQLLTISRWSVLIIAIVSTILAMMSDSIYELVSQSSILGMVCILVPMYAALFHADKQTALGATISMILGIASYAFFEWFPEYAFIPSMFIGFLLSIAGLILGNQLVKRNSQFSG